MSVVKISSELLARSPGHLKRKRGEPLSDYLRRLTHLYLQEKGIEEIENLQICRNLKVLYMYDNSISRLENMEGLTNLTHLYLQNNRISRLENVQCLRKLNKLYLGGNAITVVEGLNQLPELRELHIENQQFPSGEQLLFDPRTLVAIAPSLCVLNVCGNRLNSLSDIMCLENLTQLMAANNQLTDLNEIACLLSKLTVLWRLELTGNPLCLKSKYRERVIIMSMSLVMLDGKEINETSRQFLLNWQASKEARRQEKEKRRRYTVPSSLPTVKLEYGETLKFPLGGLSHQTMMVSANSSEFKAMISATSNAASGKIKRDVVRLPNIFAPQRYLHSVGDRSIWVSGKRSLSKVHSSRPDNKQRTSSLTKPVDT